MGNMDTIGRISFYAGAVISLLLGWMDMANATTILVVLGVIVGLLNVTAKETGRFLLAALVLVTAGLALATSFGDPVKSVLHAFIAFSAASAVVVALKEVWSIQKSK